MIGAPPGYVAYDEGGALTEAVGRRPYQVILSTKSKRRIRCVQHPAAGFDDGRLTDGKGRCGFFQHRADHDSTSARPSLTSRTAKKWNMRAGPDEAVQARFPARIPEPYRRNPAVPALERDNMVHIVDIQLRGLEKCWRSGISRWSWTTKRKKHLAMRLRPLYGARPLKRIIQNTSRTRLPYDHRGKVLTTPPCMSARETAYHHAEAQGRQSPEIKGAAA